MNTDLFFDFTVDRETNSIHLRREFAADLDLVWDAFTKAEILDQWFGPKPWRVQTKQMDFRSTTLTYRHPDSARGGMQ